MPRENLIHLHAAFSEQDNFPVVIQAVEEYFPDLIQLDVLEEDFQKKGKSTYSKFFKACVSKFTGLYTVDEIVEKFLDILKNNEKIKQFFLEKALFVPKIGVAASPQLGFIEKLRSGGLLSTEPLTYFDMVRSAKWMAKKISPTVSFSVHHLKSLPLEKVSTNVLFVNLNQNLNKMPKWCVVDLRNKHNAQVYCEAPLSEEEKGALDLALKITVNKDNYLGGKANLSVSTGYTCLAWVNGYVGRTSALTLESDFAALVEEFIFMHGGLSNGEDRDFLSEDYHAVRQDDYSFARAAIMGEIAGHEYEINDLTKALNVVKQHHISYGEQQTQTDFNARSYVLGFDAALADVNILQETADQVSLRIPENINMPQIENAYRQHCSQYVVGLTWLDNIYRDKAARDGAAEAMVLAAFRARAKKPFLHITMPNKYQLNEQEQRLILKLMDKNAYVGELQVNNNPSLKAVQKALIPNLARNRWLHHNGYLPPMADDYWRRAAKYWVTYLSEFPDVLLPKVAHEVFHRCVKEMGLQGLHAILDCLNDFSEREFFESLYQANSTAFYAACEPEGLEKYLQTLAQHVRSGAYFPYSSLGVSFYPGFDNVYIELFDVLNKHDKFEEIYIKDGLQYDPGYLRGFINNLIDAAQNLGWLNLIVIPELEDKTVNDPNIQSIRSQYTLLNDIILRNRRLRESQGLVQQIATTSAFEGGKEAGAGVDGDDAPGVDIDDNAQERFAAALLHYAQESWPLRKGGAVQLQLQQQQQIEQSRQLHIELKKVQVSFLDEILNTELVSWINIERLLGEYYNQLVDEEGIDLKYALLGSDSENPLQKFFHTWISANPAVDAKHVIQYMTQDAAKVLLRKHARLSSGLNPDNLPKGFFTQRNKDGHLVLGYKPELAYTTLPTPLTINLNIQAPKAVFWEGDFRQFDLDAYRLADGQLSNADLPYLLLFALMQPTRSYQKDFDEFIKANPAIVHMKGFNKNLVLNNWVVFYQAWQYAGNQGVAYFLSLNPGKLELNLQHAYQLLFAKQSNELQAWAAHLQLNETQLRALGQLYYRFGDDAVTLFLTKLQQIEQRLGHEFFNNYKLVFLNNIENHSAFFSESWFLTIDSMMEKLSGAANAGLRHIWLMIAYKHLSAVNWEKTETLWQVFEYFTSELNDMGLTLTGSEFDSLAASNMMVRIDRILASLKRIPGQDEKQQFLKNLHKMDLNHGGVPYAITKENFRFFDDSLELVNFNRGAPTYASDMSQLYAWDNNLELKIKRVIASSAKFNRDNYDALCHAFANTDDSAKNNLVWLLHTNYPPAKTIETLGDVCAFNPAFTSEVAHHLHNAFYAKNNKLLNVNFEAIKALHEKNIALASFFNAFPNGTFLESAGILWSMQSWTKFASFKALFSSPIPKDANYSEALYEQGYKLAVLLGDCNKEKLRRFFEVTRNLKPIARNELRLLITQLLSIDYAQSNLAVLASNEPWNSLITCINAMAKAPLQTSELRVAYISKLHDDGLRFQYSKSGDYRALRTREEDGPNGLSDFVEHEDRLWNFLQSHIAVPTDPTISAQDSLQYLMRFFKRLQLNRTYLNEIEPLLSSLETIPAGVYWTADYFYQLLRALQPQDDKRAFPITLLKTILQEPAIVGKPIDALDRQFPAVLTQMLQNVLQNTTLDRDQQARLCKIVLREFNWQGNTEISQNILNTLSQEAYQSSRGYALDILLESTDQHQLTKRFDRIVWFLQKASTTPVVTANWAQTSAHWLKAVSSKESNETLMLQVQALLNLEPEKQALVFHIMAWSTLRQGLKSQDNYLDQLDRKALKLVKALAAVSEDELVALAELYPAQPAPDAADILSFIKKRNEGGVWANILDAYLRKPNSEIRREHGSLLATREVDLQRMLKDTRISIAGKKQPLNVEQAARLTLSFTYLKQLESGFALITGATRPILEMTQKEIAAAFKELSTLVATNPDNDEFKIQLWALLFEALGRTTLKYPHLAQQFSIIANDMCVGSESRALQLATGEGKSHFVALRAAFYVARGKTVEVCTAKNTLAERDCEDYSALFNYLGVKANTINPKSSQEDYYDSKVHYTTLGSLSLFLDESSYNGNPIKLSKDDRVILFDEFDFIFFEEGLNTGYNYARPTGRTPKQMNWFYQTLNTFYTDNQERFKDADLKTNVGDLRLLVTTLLQAARDYEDRLAFVKGLMHEPLQLVQWLQSAYEANHLEFGREFTVGDENITVGDETYPMREVIPLSSDNQKMIGSSFSAGVHQLLAVRLNMEAKLNVQAQNYHVHAESNIISSQVAAERTRQLANVWEGFSGTISSTQAHRLHHEHGTEVLHVPTNQTDLRLWHKPAFYADNDARLNALAVQIRECFDKKQSILFSCKNDQQVEELRQVLRDHLTAEQYEHFLFYTNEENTTAAEVLQNKKTKEDWQGGKKQYPVCLVASGFGRGDNVEVEAVVLFNTNDKNDLLQKGGRTARNGEEGEVFQFYLANEIRDEQSNLQQALDALLNQAPTDIDAAQDGKSFQDEYESRFDILLQLREIVFSLQNQANEGYHKVLANYSSWIMQFLAELQDPTEKNRLTVAVTRDLQKIEKEWLQISSNENTNVADKLAAIDLVFNQCGENFLQEYGQFSTFVKGFAADVRVEPLALNPENAVDDSAKDALLTKLGLLLTRLHDFKLNQELMSEIILRINLLVTDDNWLGDFIEKAEKTQDAGGILDVLKLVCQQKINATDEMKEYRAGVLKPKKILQRLSAKTEEAFLHYYTDLLPEHQEKVLTHLSTPQILVSEDERVRAILPTFAFLTRFTEPSQKAWVDEYYQNIDQLSFVSAPGLLTALENLKPIQYRHFGALWQLANKYQFPILRLQDSVSPSYEKRLRMLAQCESWIRDLSLEQQQAFLTYFCHVMAQFEEGKNWDTFQRLVNLTHEKWSRHNGQERNTIMSSWQFMAESSGDISALISHIEWCIQQPGKNGFQLLSMSFSIPSERLLQHQQRLVDIWNLAEANAPGQPGLLGQVSSGKKVDKWALTAQVLNNLANRTQPISNDYVLRVLKCTDNEHMIDKLLTYPVPLDADLAPVATAQDVDAVNHLVLNYIETNELEHELSAPELDNWINGLRNASSALIARGHVDSPRIIAALLQDCKIHLEKSGTEKTLATKLQNYWSDVLEVINAINARDDENVMDCLHFNAELDDEDAKTKRVIFMQLLNQGVLVDTKRATDSVWSEGFNNTILDRALSHYVDKTKATLDSNKVTLNPVQETSLLELADELSMITQSGVCPINNNSSDESKTNRQAMSHELNKALTTYEGRWFKSKDRKVQVANLKTELAGMLNEMNAADGDRYRNVLLGIHEAKQKLMEQDNACNKKRFLKLNRGGNSRYLNTLNKMHDLVVNHWAHDKNSMLDFADYHNISKNEFLNLTKNLHLILQAHIEKKYLEEDDLHNKDLQWKIKGLFDNGKQPRLRMLLATLKSFNESLPIKAEATQKLLEQISKELAILPGPIATAAKDVLLRGKALPSYLEKAERREHRPGA